MPHLPEAPGSLSTSGVVFDLPTVGITDRALMDNPGSYNPNASHTQEDHRSEPGEGRIRPPPETIHVC